MLKCTHNIHVGTTTNIYLCARSSHENASSAASFIYLCARPSHENASSVASVIYLCARSSHENASSAASFIYLCARSSHENASSVASFISCALLPKNKARSVERMQCLMSPRTYKHHILLTKTTAKVLLSALNRN